MILSAVLPGPWTLLLALLAVSSYVLAAWPGEVLGRLAARVFVLGIAGHAGLLALEIGGAGAGSVRLGFGPVLSLTVCGVLLVHAFESRLVPLPGVRRVLAALGALAVGLELVFPGEPRTLGSSWGSLHWLLGVGSYGLFGAAVLHGLLLDSAERRLRQRKGLTGPFGLPLLQLERLTFLFVAHDLSVVRHISDRVAVMYVGQIVELAPTKSIFERPLHPYTAALLKAVPVADPRVPAGDVLLKGEVPSPASPPAGCYFNPRCPFADERCRREAPVLRELATGHSVRCHHAERLQLAVPQERIDPAGRSG